MEHGIFKPTVCGHRALQRAGKIKAAQVLLVSLPQEAAQSPSLLIESY
jgi:hypothetical protein